MNASKRLVVGGVVAGGAMLLAASLVIGAGVAKADTYSRDDAVEYVRLVREDTDGASLWAFSDAWLVREGVGVCSMLRQGYSRPYVVAGIRVDAGLPFSNSAAVLVLAASETVLCPDQYPAAARARLTDSL